MIGRYRKKPLVIEAFRWTGPDPQINLVAYLSGWGARIEPTGHWGGACGGCDQPDHDDWAVVIWNDKEGCWVRCPTGHWIIRGIEGEFYPCDPAVFDATYDAVAL